MLLQTLRHTLSLLIPHTCPVCGATCTQPHTVLCHSCLIQLPRLFSYRRADNVLADGGVNISWFRYTHSSPFAAVVKCTKYYSYPDMGRLLGRLMARQILADNTVEEGVPLLSDIDVLLPVPLHWTKQLTRGYNQSEAIARGIADVTGAAVADNLIARRPHGSQTNRTHTQRQVNVVNLFKLLEPQMLTGLRVAIVDDVITTGATSAECRNTVYNSGANPQWVGYVSLGRTMSD